MPFKGPISRSKLEQVFFRRLNAIVEPLVRRGIGSPSFTPTSVILLETVGFKSGQQRRTPLLAIRLGKYTLVSTARGSRSFWVKNLQKNANIKYYLGGKEKASKAYVLLPGSNKKPPKSFPGGIQKVASFLLESAPEGWAFAILAPQVKS
jgi:deazaflavin-dependent oxidoreductase (nitroreductase family)